MHQIALAVRRQITSEVIVGQITSEVIVEEVRQRGQTNYLRGHTDTEVSEITVVLFLHILIPCDNIHSTHSALHLLIKRWIIWC